MFNSQLTPCSTVLLSAEHREFPSETPGSEQGFKKKPRLLLVVVILNHRYLQSYYSQLLVGIENSGSAKSIRPVQLGKGDKQFGEESIDWLLKTCLKLTAE